MMKTSYYSWPNLLALSLSLTLGAGCSDASKARRILETADRDFEATNFDKAEPEYKSVFRFSPADPSAIGHIGLIYAEEGRQMALWWLEQAVKHNYTNDPKFNLKLAQFYLVTKPNEAHDLLASVLEKDPGNPQALAMLAQAIPGTGLASLYQQLETQLREGGQGAAGCRTALGLIDLRLNKVDEAETEFQSAIKLDPKLPLPYWGITFVCGARKDNKGIREALRTYAELSPVRSEARLEYANFILESADGEEEARQILLNITRQAPDYIPAWLLLMKLDFEKHRFKECEDAIGKILDRDNSPPNFQALEELGRVALMEYDAPKALNAFQRLEDAYNKIILPSKHSEIKYDLATAHLINHERQTAIACLNEAVALNTNNAPAVLMLADLDYRDDKITDAIAILRQFAEKHTTNTQAHFALANLYLAQDRLAEAIEVYKKMTSQFPRDPEVAWRAGQAYQKAGDMAAARKAFEGALQLATNYPPALECITALDISEKNFDQAHRRMADLLKNNPNASAAFLLQGSIYAAEQKTNEAEGAYSRAIELSPDGPEAYLALARLYLDSHQEQRALDRLAPLVAKTNLSAMLEVGELKQTDGKYEEARDIYEKILDVNSNFAPALNNLAYVYSAYLTNLDRAQQLAERVRDLNPMDANAPDTLGWILYKKGQYSEALSLIQQSSQKQPDDPEVQMHLGMAYYMMAEEKPAQASLERAVASKTDFPDKNLARSRLDILKMDPSKATPDIAQKIEDMVRENPKDPVLLSRLASIQEQRGEIQKAAESLQTLISMNPQNWPAMMRLARIEADRLHELRKGMELAKSAHELAPNDGAASALLGELIYQTHDYGWASSLLGQAADQSPNDPSLQYYLALADYAMGRVNAADTAMQNAVQAGSSLPEIERAKQFLALTAAAKNPAQAAAASALAKQALDKDPNDVPALMVSALNDTQAGRTNEAQQVWEKVLSIYTDFAPAKRELAIALSHSPKAEDKRRAYELGEKARDSMPDDLELTKTLAILSFECNDYRRSELLLRESLDKSTNDSLLLYYLGMDFDKLKQRKDCTNALNKALALGNLPENLAGQARAILSQMK
jgi:tetratricopeptide (TPR) repeat protein